MPSLKLFACGDYVNTAANENFIDDNLNKIIKSCDLAICNFEAPINTANMKPINKAGPHLYQDEKAIKILKDAGFNCASLANNHIYDYGDKALENTINTLSDHDIKFFGAGLSFDDAYKIRLLEKNDLKIAFIAACENEFGCLDDDKKRGGYAWIFHHLIEDTIKDLKSKVDFIILSAHAGVENVSFPIKEIRDRYKRLCDLGVSLVIGHQPHVPQGYELHNKSLIFYSLGNFYFDTKVFSNRSDDSFSAIINLEKNKSIEFEVIYHKKINGGTSQVNKQEVNFKLKNLNQLLSNQEEYVDLNNKLSIELFNKYYYHYYQEALDSTKLGFIKTCMNLVKKILFNKNNQNEKDLLLLHNIRIESHRFTVQRALSLLCEDND